MDKRSNKELYSNRGKAKVKGMDVHIHEHLLAKIKAEYTSISNLCKHHPIFDRNDVRRFLKGERNWSFAKVLVLLSVLGYQTLGLSQQYGNEKSKVFEELPITYFPNK